MLKRALTIVSTAVAVYALVTAGLYAFQRSLLYRTQAVYQTPAEVHLTGTTVVPLVAADGVHTIAWYSPAPPGAPTLVFFHGNGGSVSVRHWRIRRGQKMGYGVFLVEYRGFGGCEGSPTEEGLYADARAALDWLEARGVHSTSMILYGESLGSGVAVKMATERRVAGVVLEAPYTSTVDVAALKYWMFPVRWLMWDRFDSLSRIKKIHAPLLVMHGAADATIPQSEGRELLAAALEPKVGYFPPDGHHLDLVLHGAYDQIDQFIARFWRAPGR
ncbi:MAG: alpha/beta hydrolase [Alphaproteobacteria bacterium]|nr:alpha/beta hydrolase [Alphaproteobacteria bacterium]